MRNTPTSTPPHILSLPRHHGVLFSVSVSRLPVLLAVWGLLYAAGSTLQTFTSAAISDVVVECTPAEASVQFIARQLQQEHEKVYLHQSRVPSYINLCIFFIVFVGAS